MKKLVILFLSCLIGFAYAKELNDNDINNVIKQSNDNLSNTYIKLGVGPFLCQLLM